MRIPIAVFLVLLAVYGLLLVGIELRTSQDFVRNYVTDIEGPVKFCAVNTSLSVFLLAATGRLFLVCIACAHLLPNSRRQCWFFASLALVFGYLALDDRFKLHEAIAWRIGIGDHFVLLAVAALASACLLLLGGASMLKSSAGISLAIAAILFGIMLMIDALAPERLLLRLSIEDVLKAWSTAFFFLFSWQILLQCIQRLKQRESTTIYFPQSNESTGTATA